MDESPEEEPQESGTSEQTPETRPVSPKAEVGEDERDLDWKGSSGKACQI